MLCPDVLAVLAVFCYTTESSMLYAALSIARKTHIILVPFLLISHYSKRIRSINIHQISNDKTHYYQQHSSSKQ